MKVSIRDDKVLARLSPKAIEAFLKGSGWNRTSVIEGRATVWDIHAHDHEFQVIVPVHRSFSDYSRRIGEIVENLEMVTGLSQLDLLDRLSTSLDDVIYVSLAGSDVESGTIPIRDGVAFFDNALSLMANAATAVHDPQPVYFSKPPREVEAYLHKVRLGPTRIGSFRAQIISKILDQPLDFGINTPAVPFEREAVASLMRAMTALVNAADLADQHQDLDPFASAVPQGVSANLCSAVLGMGAERLRRNIVIDIAWSEGLEPPANLPSTVEVDRNRYDIIKQGRDFLAATTWNNDVTISGYVIRLHREIEGEIGDITLLASIEGTLRKVRVVEMSDSLYRWALDSHKLERSISLVGDLRRVGANYQLVSPRKPVPSADEPRF